MKKTNLLLLLLASAGLVYLTRKSRPHADAPLPEGFPELTPPGTIEIKTYPGVRAARVNTQTADLGNAMDQAFQPLFNHINRRNIPMTCPVVAHYPLTVANKSDGTAGVEFLYPSRAEGHTGRADDNVLVADYPEQTVIAIGVRGRYTLDATRDALKKLEHHLAHHPEYTLAGPPRQLYYNNPTGRPGFMLFSELQLPIQRTEAKSRTPQPAAAAT